MPFLQKIDDIFEASRLQHSVGSKNDDFHTYIPIEIYDGTHRFQFLIRKGKKSKILILSGKQTVYLTDHQIISTILSMGDKEIKWFLEQFVSLYTLKREIASHLSLIIVTRGVNVVIKVRSIQGRFR